MDQMYVVWDIRYTVESPEAEPTSSDPEFCGMISADEYSAYDWATQLVSKDGHELVMVILLRPWMSPELVKVVGEFSGKMALDWYRVEKMLREELAKAVDWAIGKVELRMREVEVT